jgi:hypothetical protein
MAFPFFTLISCILILILIIATTIAIGYYELRQNAYHYPSPWCYNWQCNCTSTTPVTGSAAFLAALSACKPDPNTGNVDPVRCSCAAAGWTFYNPTTYPFDTPPGTTIPNYCLNP